MEHQGHWEERETVNTGIPGKKKRKGRKGSYQIHMDRGVVMVRSLWQLENVYGANPGEKRC